MDKITVGVLTISDRCDRKEAVDESGPGLINMIGDGVVKSGCVVKIGLVADSKEDIERVLEEWAEEGLHLILTTGGTGVAERDVTPEATAAVLEKTVPGISQLMFKRSSEQTPFAALSRGIAGVRGKTLIVNLPGSKKGSRECLEAVAGVIPHAVDLIHGNNEEVKFAHGSVREKKSSVVVGEVAGRKRESPYPCLSVRAAQEILEDRVYLLRKEKVVRFEQALGHVLAQDVIARDDLPPFDASIKDGYAVLSSDKIHERTVLSVSHAGGSLLDMEVLPGQCVRVSTGAVIPPGADAVVQVEDTSLVSEREDRKEEDKIIIKKLPPMGQDIRKKGSDFKMGQRLLTIGTYLDSAALGLLAAAGVTSLRVFRKPLVAVISTGDELLSPDDSLRPGKVRDSNRITLLSLLKEENYQTVDGGIVLDNPDALRNALERAFRTADIVVTTGSMSMGERDYLKAVLVSDFNAEICFGRVQMKPGKPTAMAIVMFEGNPKLWFGLPGNPASALVTSHLFLLPALRRISGHQKIFPMSVNASLETPVVREDRPQYVRAVLTYNDKENLWSARVLGNQSSSRIGSCVNANCFVEVPAVPEEGSQQTRVASQTRTSSASGPNTNSTFGANPNSALETYLLFASTTKRGFDFSGTNSPNSASGAANPCFASGTKPNSGTTSVLESKTKQGFDWTGTNPILKAFLIGKSYI